MERFEKPLKFGLITGVILITFSILTYAFQIDKNNLIISLLISLLTYGVLIAFAAIVMVKTRNGNENYSYGAGFLSGFILLLAAFYIGALYSFVFDAYIDPDHSVLLLNKTIERLEATNVPTEIIDKTYEQLLKSLNPTRVLLTNLWFSPVMSAIMSAIVALFVPKKKAIE